MRHVLAALMLAALLPDAPALARQPAASAAELPGASVFRPARAAELVREVDVGPWELRWVGDVPPGDETDIADGAALSALLDDPGRPLAFERAGAVVVRMPMGEVKASARVAGKPVAAYQYISAAESGGSPDSPLQLQRTWFALYEPRVSGSDEAAAKGLVLLLPGMFGTPEPVIDGLVGMLRGRGWHVLRMLTHPSRFTESASYMLVPDGDVRAVASEIATVVSDRAAECVLAVEAVCAHIGAVRPGVPVGKRIGLGLSGGGIVLPAVIAGNPQAYHAAVFVGAGCDFAQIAIESNYTDWIDSVRITWLGEPDVEARGAFTDAFRSEAALDGYAVAPGLAGLPMLMIHGESDKAVPAPMGDLLWERLGRPERWSAAVGHESLFLMYLPSRTPDLLDWLDEHGGE